MEHKFLNETGKYSGSRRLDTSDFEELRYDDEETKEKWLGGIREIKFKRKLKRWRNNISEDIDFDELFIHLVGQSHIDCAWMWRFEQTRKKAQVTFRKAITHSKMFPETFCYALSEPILLEWIKEDNIELFKDIQETVKKGNIELVGGSYVEPDCMMISGEALVRQRLYGMRFYRDNFGILPEVEWFLDSFGYNHGLPQILSKSGAKYFWTSKLTWNQDTIFPFVHFWWQSPDGSRILTANFHMDVQVLETWNDFKVGRKLLKSEGKKVWDYTMDYSKLNDHMKPETCPLIGFFFGLSDGGHGPTHKEVAFANEYAKLSPFKWSRVHAFFNELQKYSKEFPIWNDELYLENHRGCFSNHIEVKRYNRKFESLTTSLEFLAILTSLANSHYQYPLNKIETLWKVTLKNQFHDVLPGSSIPEVYDEVWNDWNIQKDLIRDITKDIGASFSNNGERKSEKDVAHIILYNSLSWERTSRVFIPITVFEQAPVLNSDGKPNHARITLLDGEGSSHDCQPVAEENANTIDPFPAGWWTVIKLKPLSMTSAKISLLSDSEEEKITKDKCIKVSKNSISNNLVSVKLDANTGAMVELTATHINNDNNLLKGTSSNLTYAYLDDNKQYPAWNLTPEYWKHPLEFSQDSKVNISITENGPIFATLQVSRMLGNNPVWQSLTLFKDCPEVFLEYDADWKQKNVMLKVLYSTQTNAETAVADGIYCAIKFKTNPETPCDKARFEKICHEFCDISTPDNDWGLALLNEGRYAFDVNSGDMRLTMLRACRYPPPAPEAWVIEERKVNEELYGHQVPEFSGMGPLKCRYALYPHEGGALLNVDGSPNPLIKRKAEEFNNPIVIIPINNLDSKSNEFNKWSSEPLLEIQSPNVFLGALKMNEWDKDGTIIMRFNEGLGVPSMARVKISELIANKIPSIKVVDLLEREINHSFKWNDETNILSFELTKFEIITFKLILESKK
ncbi:MAG: alpha-mannosidase [Promethearchaeota archaeon]|nr:MAG: alpha-mannosidase [Candidatus Lokiarchaeota archaeon]